MSVRRRFNSLYFFGALLLAGLLGAVCQSPLVFVITLVLTLGWLLQHRHIRPEPKGRPGPGGR